MICCKMCKINLSICQNIAQATQTNWNTHKNWHHFMPLLRCMMWSVVNFNVLLFKFYFISLLRLNYCVGIEYLKCGPATVDAHGYRSYWGNGRLEGSLVSSWSLGIASYSSPNVCPTVQALPLLQNKTYIDSLVNWLIILMLTLISLDFI